MMPYLQQSRGRGTCSCYVTTGRGQKEKQHCHIQRRKLLPLPLLLNAGGPGGGEWSCTRREVKAERTGWCGVGAASSPPLAYAPFSACPAQLLALTTVGRNRNKKTVILQCPVSACCPASLPCGWLPVRVTGSAEYPAGILQSCVI